MKRSQINRLIDDALAFFDKSNFRLPPWAQWTVEDWLKTNEETKEIRTHRLGWNLTDFGSGNFDKVGLILFVLRNGRLVKGLPSTTKTYAEKAMMVRPGQITPWHFHWMKTEDLVNRGGGRLEVELGWVSGDEKSIAPEEVVIQVDGITRRLPAGGKLVLEPGESVTLPPRMCHQFCGHVGDQPVCVGEVSSLNDDGTDNCFLFGAGPPTIEEDCSPKYWLCSEYPALSSGSVS